MVFAACGTTQTAPVTDEVLGATATAPPTLPPEAPTAAVTQDAATTEDATEDAAATQDAEEGGTEVATAEPSCDDLGIALNLVDGTDQAAARFIAATSPGPAGLVEALDTLVALYEGASAPLTYREAISRLEGYYGEICNMEFQTDFGLEEDGAAEQQAHICEVNQEPWGDDVVVTNIPADDPDGGLVGHTGPGVSEAVVLVLPAGTTVGTGAGQGSCWLAPSGAVWWEIWDYDTNNWMWVNATYLGAIDETTDNGGAGNDDGAANGGDEDFDVEVAQWSCYTLGFDPACDVLVQYGYQDHQGNQYQGAPTEDITDGCVEGDNYACALLGQRGIILDDAHQSFINAITSELTANCDAGFETACNLLLSYP